MPSNCRLCGEPTPRSLYFEEMGTQPEMNELSPGTHICSECSRRLVDHVTAAQHTSQPGETECGLCGEPRDYLIHTPAANFNLCLDHAHALAREIKHRSGLTPDR